MTTQNALGPAPGGNHAVSNLTAVTAVKASAGRLVRVNVVVAGSAPGSVNNAATTGAAAAANKIASIPNTVGTYLFDWPCDTGITVSPGTGQTVSVSYS